MAYGPFGRRVLEASLQGGWAPVGVMTHDDPSDLDSVSVELVARDAGLQVTTAEPNGAGMSWLRSLDPDVIFTVNYRRILAPEVLEVPRKGGFNIHGSLLPTLRGRSPLTWAIILGHEATGVTVHTLTREVDAGEIVFQERIPISVRDTSGSIQSQMADFYPGMVLRTLDAVAQGSLQTRPQTGQPTYGSLRLPDDGAIDWSWNARRIYDWVRALTEPYPGAFTHVGKQKLMIWRVSIIEPNDFTGSEPGVVVGQFLNQSADPSWAVSCGNGYVVLEEADSTSLLSTGTRLGSSEEYVR